MTTIREVPLKDLCFDPNSARQELLVDSDYIKIGDGSSIRLYHRDLPMEVRGFSFHAVEWIGLDCTNEEPKDHWEPALCTVSSLLHGVAYFDGIRHIWYGDEWTDSMGYHYYPDVEALGEVFRELRKLEKKHCDEDML